MTSSISLIDSIALLPQNAVTHAKKDEPAAYPIAKGQLKQEQKPKPDQTSATSSQKPNLITSTLEKRPNPKSAPTTNKSPSPNPNPTTIPTLESIPRSADKLLMHWRSVVQPAIEQQESALIHGTGNEIVDMVREFLLTCSVGHLGVGHLVFRHHRLTH